MQSSSSAVDALVERYVTQLHKTLNTTEKCDKYINNAKSILKEFNDSLSVIQKATSELNSNKIDKSEFDKITKKPSKYVTSKCKTLYYHLNSPIKTVGKEDIENFKRYTTGLIKGVTDIKVNLNHAAESVYSDEDNIQHIFNQALESLESFFL